MGTKANPIDARLSTLQDHGGPTFTQALLSDSPALNTGNPAVPGSGGYACLATDQRGIARPIDSTCDMGAYEGSASFVKSITRTNPDITSAASVSYIVTFSGAVTGVDINDFALTTTGLTGAATTSVSGSGSTYTVNVYTGLGVGSLRLDVVDDGSIVDTLGNPLGGPGPGNGNFTAGQSYSVYTALVALTPNAANFDTTPTYKWSKIAGAIQYQYQLWKGAKLVYTKLVPASACKGVICSNTPTNILGAATYQWKVRARVKGVWKNYSDFQTFTVVGPQDGWWEGNWGLFEVTPARNSLMYYTIYFSVRCCGNYSVTRTGPVPIKNDKFSFSGTFHADGTFGTLTSVRGTLGFSSYYIPGCGYISGNVPWKAAWYSSASPVNLPAPGAGEDSITRIPASEKDKDLPTFTVDPVKP